MRFPVPRIAVLIQPYVSVVGRAQGTDVIDPYAEEASNAVRLCDDMDLATKRLHKPPRRQVAAGVGDAQESVALAGRDHAQCNS